MTPIIQDKDAKVVEETKEEEDSYDDEEAEEEDSEEEQNPKDFWYWGWIPNPAEEYQ